MAASDLLKQISDRVSAAEDNLRLTGEVRPSFQELLQWRDELNSNWESGTSNTDSLDDQQEADEALYFQNYSVTAIDGDPYAAQTGSAPEDVDATVDSLVPSRILIKVVPPGGDKKAKDKADRLRRGGQAVLEAWRRPKDIIREIVVDMVHRRYAVARVMFDERLWRDDPSKLTKKQKQEDVAEWKKKHFDELPIVLDRRPARFTRWREHRGKMVLVVEDYWTTVLEAKQQFWQFPQAQRILLQKDPFDNVRVSDVWYEDWRALFLDDRPIFESDDGVLEHGYDEIPYVTAAFRELATYDEPGKRFRGPTSNVAGLYPAESRVLSMQLTMLAFNAWRTHVGHTVDGREIRIIPGHYIDIDKNRGEYLELLRGDPVPDELLRTESVIDQLIQRNSSSASGRGSDNARSAQQLYAAQALRGLKTEPARDALALLIEKALKLVMMEIETIVGEPITLPYPVKSKDSDFGLVTIGPNNIGGYWGGFRVSFGKRLDPASLEQAKVLQNWSKDKWISWETSHELAEVLEDIAHEEETMVLEAVDRLPFMIETAAADQVENYYGETSWQYSTIRTQIEQGRSEQANQGGAASLPAPGGNVSGQDLPSISQGGVAPANNTA